MFIIMMMHVSDVFFLEVGHFTLDNTSNNGTMLEEMEVLLGACEIPFDAVNHKVMCFGHIIDLSHKWVIIMVDNKAHTSNDEHDYSLSDDETVASNPIVHACSVVGVIQGSGLQRDAFHEVIMNGNAKGWFKQGDPLETVQLKPLQLL
jgi:hypothetical protein